MVPGVLLEQGKAKNPWPNVDAHSGVLLQVRLFLSVCLLDYFMFFMSVFQNGQEPPSFVVEFSN